MNDSTHDPTTNMFLRLPISLKLSLEQYAISHKLNVSHTMRLAVARLIGLPDSAADMHGPTPLPTDERRRNKARRMQRQLATLAPTAISVMLENKQ